MPIFKCDKCGCVENTACSNYWTDKFANPPKPTLCSECDPSLGKWHNKFPKESAEGLLLGKDGFLYSDLQHHTKIVGIVLPSGNIDIVSEAILLDYISVLKFRSAPAEQARLDKMTRELYECCKEHDSQIVTVDEQAMRNMSQHED